jgi:hypothetical protein|tara:strand:- start:2241 stop:2672 length:432 start_codon:yes stop_codon:yes gene_type:complete
MVYQIAYVSVTNSPLAASDISDILKVSQKNNAREGITGLLMYHDQLFFQVLEGERPSVETSYERIGFDKRHQGLTLVWEGEVEERAFPAWSMGLADPDALGEQNKANLRSLPELKRREGSILTGDTLAEELVRSVLNEFRGVR